MLPSEIMIWQPEFTDKILSRKPGAVQDAMESQANTVYKLAQARNIDDKAVMEAIRLLKDVAESQQQQFQSPPQSPADLMPS
ncbi:hypothetical protein C2900_004540 [Escherichia coli]|nr:hypothetical protein [Escherichia coli]EFA9147999.1 hypothetical protein [Escherichia coli]EFA9155873.1 hypothetical protein [Escherichia coli]